MSLQRRLLVYLLLCAPLVWAVALLVSASQARHEVNELFDSELIRLARQVQVTLVGVGGLGPAEQPESSAGSGEADLRDLAIAVWNGEGRLLLVDREGVQLPRLPDAVGFVDMPLGGEPWRVYYLQSPRGEWLVAAGQRAYERDELVWGLLAGEILPWLLVLPVLLVAMTWAVRRALAPLRALAAELRGRGADELQPVPASHAPSELQPVLAAMNGLFERIDTTLARERRFTADAAHELRTPLAVLRAQWDVLRRASSEPERRDAEVRFGAGLDRMDRLVTQMLAMSRLEATERLPQTSEVNWTAIVEQVTSDVLPLAERRRIEIACDWPPPGRHPMPLLGDEHLLTVLLRNLLDNAVRYAPAGSAVLLRFGEHELVVENDGEPLAPEALARIGERFHRPEGQPESGSGLGVSIVQRIAALHGLETAFGVREAGRGTRVTLRFKESPRRL